MMNKKQTVIAVVGPTASGKTAVGIALAKEYGGEIVSADSMQIYKGLDITTAKPTQNEMDGIVHHLISEIDPAASFSVAEYVKLAKKRIEEIAEKGKIPILVGGTGLYVSSLIDNISFENQAADAEVRKRLEREALEVGREAMHEKLRKLDPEAAGKIPAANAFRVIRALEVCITTGIPFSRHKEECRSEESLYNACMIGLTYEERSELYNRINRRVDEMLENGMLEECKEVYENESLGTVCQAIGYKELIPFFEGKCTKEECIDKIKQYTRNYAKRQLTWFRRDERINWVKIAKDTAFSTIIQECKKIVAKSEIL